MSPIERSERSNPTFWFGIGVGGCAGAVEVDAFPVVAEDAEAEDAARPAAGASSSVSAPAMANAFAPPTLRAT